MTRYPFRGLALVVLGGALAFATPAEPQTVKGKVERPAPKVTVAPSRPNALGSGTLQPKALGTVMPKMEAVAETRLLMEGLAHPNFRGLERSLDQKPADAKTWDFARGQALLIAETANLLMLRPPRSQGQPEWFDRAMALRLQAAQLAKSLEAQDHGAARSGLVALANSCNNCHQTFRVAIEIAPFAPPEPGPAP